MRLATSNTPLVVKHTTSFALASVLVATATPTTASVGLSALAQRAYSSSAHSAASFSSRYFGGVASPFLQQRPTLADVSRIGQRLSTSVQPYLPPHLLALVAPFSTSRVVNMGSDSSKHAPHSDLPKGKSEEEWRTVLSPAQFRVLREQGTEPAFTSDLDKHYPKAGVYTCAGCDAPLYKADHKFKSGCGWPAFFDAIPGAVKRNVDRTFGMKRIEIRCAACDGHLGHVFEGEGFPTPTDERHCVNGISLRFSDQDKPVTDGKM